MTYGDELADDPKTLKCLDNSYRLKHSWPNQLKELISLDEFFNHGKGGGSNERILRTTIGWTSKYLNDKKDPSDLFVVIGWSAPARYEIRFKDEWVDIHPQFTPRNTSLRAITRFYGRNIADEEVDIIKTFVYILSLQSWLESNKIPYLFFDALPIRHNQFSALDEYKKQINKKRYFNFGDDSYNMHVAISQEGHLLGPGRHPLEEGHAFWAKTLSKFVIDHNLTVF